MNKTKLIRNSLYACGMLLLMSCKNHSNKEKTTNDHPKISESKIEEKYTANKLSQAEIKEGWQLLFDGKTSKGWRGYGSDSFPSGWRADGSLNFHKDRKEEGEGNQTIVYEREFKNFHLKLDWKISEAGNSGIFYLGKDSSLFDRIYFTAPEMQVLDNDMHPDSDQGVNGNRKAGSLFDLIPANPKHVKSVGDWNTVEIIVNQGNVKHFMNGQSVVEYQLWTPEWEEMVKNSKFPSLNANWAKVAKKGLIGLQDHNDDVWFRNIRIKEL